MKVNVTSSDHSYNIMAPFLFSFFLFLSIRSVSQSKFGDQSISSLMADLHQNLNRVFHSAGALTENFLEGIIIKEVMHLPK